MHYVIVGLGATGFSVACYLALKNSSYKITIIDSRDNPPYLEQLKKAYPNIVIYLGSWHHKIQQTADFIVLSPGVSSKHIVSNVNIINDIELFAQNKPDNIPVVAITGTNGKSTITTLVAAIATNAGLNVAIGGNIGTPVLTLLDKNPVPDLYILELSSFHLEITKSLHPHIGVLLNLTPDHLDRYDTIEEYFTVKHKIFNNCEYAVYNGADPNILVPSQSKVSDFSKVFLDANLPVTIPKINAKAVFAIGKILNINKNVIKDVLQNFITLKHRQELVFYKNNISWINDSKATNVSAAKLALKTLGSDKRNIILIAGGKSKQEDLQPICNEIATYCKQVFLLGETSEELYKILYKIAPCMIVSSMQQAVQQAIKVASENDIVLLSPACSSLDMFKNFEERGIAFQKAVRLYA